MRRFRKTVTALLVWVSVASSLFGSTPHFVCRCPDGTVKLFCSGQCSSESPCCCNGKSCCSTSDGNSSCKNSSSAGQEKKDAPSCCHQGKSGISSEAVDARASEKNAQNTVADPRSGSRLAINKTCCEITQVQSEGQTLVQPVTKHIEHLELGLVLLLPLNVGFHVPSSLQVRNGWQVNGLPPPPTDLLTLLQRFRI